MCEDGSKSHAYAILFTMQTCKWRVVWHTFRRKSSVPSYAFHLCDLVYVAGIMSFWTWWRAVHTNNSIHAALGMGPNDYVCRLVFIRIYRQMQTSPYLARKLYLKNLSSVDVGRFWFVASMKNLTTATHFFTFRSKGMWDFKRLGASKSETDEFPIFVCSSSGHGL